MIKDLIQKDLDWNKPIQQVTIYGKGKEESVVDVVHAGQIETSFGLIHFVNFTERDTHPNTLIFNHAGERIGSFCKGSLGVVVNTMKDYIGDSTWLIRNKKEPKKVVRRILIHDDGGIEVFEL